MLWDNHPIHQRKTVTEFITKHPRLHVYNFPAYAPEVNPTEGVWAQSKESTAGTAPRNLDELHRNVYKSIRRTRNSKRLLRACFGTRDLRFLRMSWAT